ncbi:hypothetical protein [Nocardioides aequoreus]|uniref:hypothetical protein n=1 Tax=Nocardioides aequoreus TaxID=397278 RepID=UPI0004C40C48|nr:hypothetical protein [Nocardioides aequoreus]
MGALTSSAVLLLTAAGCGGEASAPTGAPTGALPEGLTAYVDQPRAERVGRGFVVRLVNDTGSRVTVTRADVSSDRVDPLRWQGEKSFVNEADLDLELGEGRCGRGSDMRVELAYRVGDGPEQVGVATATDRYGAVGLLLDRDCAASVLAEAADLSVGEPRRADDGGEPVLELPLELRPTGARDDVVWGGLEDTVLFRQAPGSASVEAGTRVPLGPGDPPVRLLLRVGPGRCDPHALAEDKVGTLFAMRVEAPGVPAEAGAYLPLTDADRAALRGFIPVACGW